MKFNKFPCGLCYYSKVIHLTLSDIKLKTNWWYVCHDKNQLFSIIPAKCWFLFYFSALSYLNVHVHDFQMKSTALVILLFLWYSVYIYSFHQVVIITLCLREQLNNNVMVKQGNTQEGSVVIDSVLNTPLFTNQGIVCLES